MISQTTPALRAPSLARVRLARFSLALVGLALLGCVMPVEPPPPPPEPCAAPTCGECLLERERPVEARLLASAAPLGALLDSLEADTLEQCQSMAGRLQVSPFPERIADCEVLEPLLRARIVDLFPLGIMVGLTAEPVRCAVSLERARQCAQECDSEPAEVRCDGELNGACEGVCRGTCQGACDGEACLGTCSDFCTGSCDGSCFGQCEGECGVTDRCGNCVTLCEGDCERGVCQGICDGECSGVCTGACDGACDGLCVGECDGLWSGDCHGVVSVESETCGLVCTVEAALEAECPISEVRARGPEVFEPRDHALVDQAVLIASTTLERSLATHTRVVVTLLPWLSSYRSALERAAAQDDGACLSDAAAIALGAEARAARLEALLGGIIAAVEDSVGTKLD